jgi:DNA-binding NarL/FixJ family response regulator
MPLTAAIVEDDPFTRTMLVATLRAQGVEVLIETATPAEALALARLRRPRVALLDLHLGAGPTGIDLAHALRMIDPRIAIVILTSFDDPRLLSTRLPEPPRGARYVTKREIESVEALLRVLKDAVDATVEEGARSGGARQPPARTHASDSHRVVDLTDSQLETLQLLAEGLSNAHIALRRSVTERSVETTIGRIARALGLAPDATRNQRVHMARVYLRSIGTQPPHD